jgi:hypothetical protein
VSGKYDAGRDAFGEGRICWSEHTVMAQLVSADYRFDAAHRDPAGIRGRVGNAVALNGKTMQNGWAKAESIGFSQVSGPRVTGMVLWHAGEQGSTLIVHLDQVSGFPIQPNGGDIHVDAPRNELFRI